MVVAFVEFFLLAPFIPSMVGWGVEVDKVFGAFVVVPGSADELGMVWGTVQHRKCCSLRRSSKFLSCSSNSASLSVSP